MYNDICFTVSGESLSGRYLELLYKQDDGLDKIPYPVRVITRLFLAAMIPLVALVDLILTLPLAIAIVPLYFLGAKQHLRNTTASLLLLTTTPFVMLVYIATGALMVRANPLEPFIRRGIPICTGFANDSPFPSFVNESALLAPQDLWSYPFSAGRIIPSLGTCLSNLTVFDPTSLTTAIQRADIDKIRRLLNSETNDEMVNKTLRAFVIHWGRALEIRLTALNLLTLLKPTFDREFLQRFWKVL